MLDDDGQVMMAAHYNTDLGDGWEHTFYAGYPTKYTNEAYKIGINFLIYRIQSLIDRNSNMTGRETEAAVELENRDDLALVERMQEEPRPDHYGNQRRSLSAKAILSTSC